MSKRRKIDKSEESSSESKEIPRIVKFKQELLSLVSGGHMDKSLNWFFKNANQSKYRFHKTVPQFKQNWVDKSGEEKVKLVELLSGSETEKLLRNAISRLNKKPMIEISAKYLSEEIDLKGLSKQHLVEELINFYFEGVGSYEKRKTEENNITDLMEDEGDYEYRFIDMCGESIPRELLILIIYYLGYNKNTLFQVGSVCKTLYFTILTSWPRIRIKKKNIYHISIAVLKSIRSIEIEGDNLLTTELDHIFNHISSDRLRKITFVEVKISSFAKILRFFQTKTKKSKDCSFRNVLSISYSVSLGMFTKKGIRKSDISDYQKLFKMNLFNIFPNLRVFHNPMNLKFLSEYKLEELALDLRLPFRVKQEAGDKPILYENIIPSQLIYMTNKNKEKIRKLHIIIPIGDIVGLENLHKLFSSGFSKLEELVLEVLPKYKLDDPRYVYHHSSTKVSSHIDILSCLSPIKNTLRKLLLYDFSMLWKENENSEMGKDIPEKQIWKFPSSSINDFLGNLEEIDIKDIVSRGRRYSSVGLGVGLYVNRTIDDLLFCFGLNLKRIEIELGLQKNKDSVKFLLFMDYLENRLIRSKLEFLRIDFFYAFPVSLKKKSEIEEFSMRLVYLKKKKYFLFKVSDWKSRIGGYSGLDFFGFDRHRFTTVSIKEVLLMNMLLNELPKILSKMWNEKRVESIKLVDGIHFIKNTDQSNYNPPVESWKERIKRVKEKKMNKEENLEEEKLRLYNLFKKKMEEEEGFSFVMKKVGEWRRELLFSKELLII